MCGLGLVGEVGEVADLYKKTFRHKEGREVNGAKVLDIDSLACVLDSNLDLVMYNNVEKLKDRHGITFSSEYTSDKVKR